MRLVVSGLLLVAACAAPAPPTQAGTPGVDAPQTGLAQAPLSIRTADGRTRRFRVEVARTPEEQRIGMMFRRQVASDRGMLFPYDRPGHLGFWMRNTLIPLDLLFIRADGTVARIVTGRPRDETSLQSGEPVIAVLEIAGGNARRLGIRPGDRVTSPALARPGLPATRGGG